MFCYSRKLDCNQWSLWQTVLHESFFFFFQELTDKMKAFVEKYEQKTDGKIGIIEVRKLKPYAILK